MKCLAVIKEEGYKIGVVFCDYQSGRFEIFSMKKLSELEKTIEIYSPDAIVSRENYSLPLPSLSIISASQHKKLERKVRNEEIIIEGLIREKGKTFYPAYYFQGRKLTRMERWALYALYLFKPWQEVQGIENESRDQEDLQDELSAVEEIKDFSSLSAEKIKKIYNNMSLEIKDLVKNISEASKLSYLSGLNSEEIVVLLKNVENFKKVLERIYPLKKQEEEKKNEYGEENDNDKGN